MHKALALILPLVLGACASTPASRESEPDAAPMTNAALRITEGPGKSDHALYEALGKLPGIGRAVDASLAEIHNDLRINLLFGDTDLPYLRARLIEQICEASGGPCAYSGLSMEEAHSGMDISEAEFGYFVEDLTAALTKIGVSAEAQSQLLGALAPMQPQVVHQ